MKYFLHEIFQIYGIMVSHNSIHCMDSKTLELYMLHAFAYIAGGLWPELGLDSVVCL